MQIQLHVCTCTYVCARCTFKNKRTKPNAPDIPYTHVHAYKYIYIHTHYGNGKLSLHIHRYHWPLGLSPKYLGWVRTVHVWMHEWSMKPRTPWAKNTAFAWFGTRVSMRGCWAMLETCKNLLNPKTWTLNPQAVFLSAFRTLWVEHGRTGSHTSPPSCEGLGV